MDQFLKELQSELFKVNFLEGVKAEIRLLEAYKLRTKNLFVLKDINAQIKSWKAIQHLVETYKNN